VALANVEEFYHPITSTLDKHGALRWRDASRRVAGGAFYWSGAGSALVVLAGSVDSWTVEQISMALGAEREVIRMGCAPHKLCEALADDESAFGRLARYLDERPGTVLRPWGVTRGFAKLCAKLEAVGVAFATEGDVEQTSAYVSGALGSKSGFRHLMNGLPGGLASSAFSGAAVAGRGADFGGLVSSTSPVSVPAGCTAHEQAEAAGLAALMLARGRGVYLKADRSASGVGVLGFSPWRKPGAPLLRHLKIAARTAGELKRGPFVVEEDVAAGGDVEGKAGGGAVRGSVQLCADGAGAVEPLFCARHVEGGAMVGAALPPEVAQGFSAAALTVGRAASAMGLVGIHGVDMVTDCNRRTWAVELNARRTTLSAAGGVLQALEGDGSRRCVRYFEDGAALSAALGAGGKRFILDRATGECSLPVPVVVDARDGDHAHGRDPSFGGLITSATRERE